MTVEITAGTLIGGVPAKAGDIVDVDSAEANILIGYGKAKRYEDPRKKAEEEAALKAVEEAALKAVEEEAKKKQKGGNKK